MKKGFTVRTAWKCSFGDEIIVVANFKYSNEVVNYPFVKYDKEDINSTDVGMWRVKNLKK